MEDTLVHELVHMYDHAKFKVDWEDIRHHACSEVRSYAVLLEGLRVDMGLILVTLKIRAANLSGDCRWSREIRRGFYTFSKQHQVCPSRTGSRKLNSSRLTRTAYEDAQYSQCKHILNAKMKL